jgi:hypothetical protein
MPARSHSSNRFPERNLMDDPILNQENLQRPLTPNKDLMDEPVPNFKLPEPMEPLYS